MSITSRRPVGLARPLAAVVAALMVPVPVPAQQHVEVLQAVGALPAHVAAAFAEPIAFERAVSGDAYVFDRRDQTVYRLPPTGEPADPIVRIGPEPGRILLPGAFDLTANGTFVVADAPNRRERIQIFSPDGARLGGFMIPGRTSARVSIGGFILNGVSSLDYTGRSILVNQPERGTLITVYGLSGTPVRTFGTLRRTGFETNRDVHLALNTGLPLAIPDGGYYFVFQTGRPRFHRYDADGRLLFERHIEGPELDPLIAALPTQWPVRRTEDGFLPLVPPTIRTAAVDPSGRLWVALTQPYVYVYDRAGEKIHTLQLDGAGPLRVTSLSFPGNGRVLVTPGCYEFAVP